MPKIIFIIALLACTFLVKAQSYFEGNINYKVVVFNKQKDLNPSINIDYGKGFYFGHMDAKDDVEEIIVDVKNNKEYKIDRQNKSYYLRNNNNTNEKFIFESTTEQKRYFGKLITKYIIEKKSNNIIYAWFSNDYKMNCNADTCQNGKAPFVLNGYIALIIESYHNNQKEFAMYATDIETKQYDQNYFSLAGYTNQNEIEIKDTPGNQPPPAEVAEPAPNTIMEEGKKVFSKVEIEPRFIGNWIAYKNANLKYPVDVPNKPQCNCTITFTVNANGTLQLPINNIKCSISDNRFTSAARKFISDTNGKWIAALQNGEKVNAQHTIVLEFQYK